MYSNAFAPSGRTSSLHHTQGDALGYVLVAPSGRALNACICALIELAKLEYITVFPSLCRKKEGLTAGGNLLPL